MHFANRSKNTRNRLEILLATSAVVLIFFRDPIGVPGGPYKVDKSLRDVPSRGAGLQEAPQGGPGGSILVDFEFFQNFELQATPGCQKSLITPQECCLGHYYTRPESPDDSGLDISVQNHENPMRMGSHALRNNCTQ